MTEQQIRQLVVDKAWSFMGAKRGSAAHRAIIDTYNSHPDLPLRNGRPYKVTYTDNWCAAFVSSVAIALGLTEIMPVECSCTAMIELYKAKGRWVEDDAYVPQIGDIIMYYWGDGKDYATTDQTHSPNHVGIVTNMVGSTITVIEGNMGSTSVVGERTVQVNGRYIRGYCCPDYASMEDKPPVSNLDTKEPWYAENWKKATDLGLVDGTRPEDPITRAEVAEIVLRALYGQKGAE